VSVRKSVKKWMSLAFLIYIYIYIYIYIKNDNEADCYKANGISATKYTHN